MYMIFFIDKSVLWIFYGFVGRLATLFCLGIAHFELSLLEIPDISVYLVQMVTQKYVRVRVVKSVMSSIWEICLKRWQSQI